LAVAGVALAMLTACASAPEREFEGPWGAEFEQAYRAATNPFVKQVLRDGVVTDSEYAEMWERFVACMNDAGFRVFGEAPGGAYRTDMPPGVTPEQAHGAAERCWTSTGEAEIGSLYWWVKQNPDHEDTDKLMVDCLRREGVISEGYGVEDFAKEKVTGEYSFSTDGENSDAFARCSDDPLGVFG
jgi:hypothetical protein